MSIYLTRASLAQHWHVPREKLTHLGVKVWTACGRDLAAKHYRTVDSVTELEEDDVCGQCRIRREAREETP